MSSDESVRFGAELGSRRVYLAKGSGDEVCLVAIKGAGPTFSAATSCGPLSQLTDTPLIMTLMNDDDTADVVALAPDGGGSVSQGRRASRPIRNVLALAGLHADGGPVQVDTDFASLTLEPSELQPAVAP